MTALIEARAIVTTEMNHKSCRFLSQSKLEQGLENAGLKPDRKGSVLCLYE